MTLDFTFFALAIPAVIFAGVSKGGFGSGGAFAATPLLALILEPAQAVGVMLPLLMLMDAGALKPYWKKWDRAVTKALIIGSVPGVLIGTALYRFADPNVFKFLIGVVAVAFVIFQLARARGMIPAPKQAMSDRAGMVAGAAAGFTSFISHAGGPPAAIFMLSRGMTKTSFQATTVIVFWAINLLKFGPYFAIGIFSKETFTAAMYLAPVALIGVYLGVYFHRMIREKTFFALTYTLLLITGSKLIWDSLV